MKTKIVIVILITLPFLILFGFAGKGFYNSQKESWVASGVEQGKAEGILQATDELVVATMLENFRQQGVNVAINKIFDEIEVRGEVNMSKTRDGVEERLILVEKK